MTYKATCGHNDPLGCLAGVPCGACVRKAHAKAVGRRSRPVRGTKKGGK